VNLQTLHRLSREVFNDALPNDRNAGILTLEEERLLVQQVKHLTKERRDLKNAVRYWRSLTSVRYGGDNHAR